MRLIRRLPKCRDGEQANKYKNAGDEGQHHRETSGNHLYLLENVGEKLQGGKSAPLHGAAGGGSSGFL